MNKIIGIGILGILLFAAFFSSGCIDILEPKEQTYTLQYVCYQNTIYETGGIMMGLTQEDINNLHPEVGCTVTITLEN